jgi:hypothetical protein
MTDQEGFAGTTDVGQLPRSYLGRKCPCVPGADILGTPNLSYIWLGATPGPRHTRSVSACLRVRRKDRDAHTKRPTIPGK